MDKLWIDKYDKNKYIQEMSDHILAVGGDGTLLRAIKMHRNKNKPFFGVAAGSVNFLMNDSPWLSNNHKVKKFNLIKAKITYTSYAINNKPVTKQKVIQAFNDIYIVEENGWIEFDVKDKDFIIGKFKGSGLIVSTPQGSTGINKNNNGVILPLSAKSWSVTGDKTDRKINYILTNQKIEINVKSRGFVNVYIDGHNNKVSNVTKIVLTRGNKVDVLFNNYKQFKQKRVLR